MASQLRNRAEDGHRKSGSTGSKFLAPSETSKIVIIGTGFSGFCAAIQLKLNGFTDFVMLEKEQALGGTWRDNTYPGAACDIPSYLYSFSFAMKPDWSRKRATQKEILAYMEDLATKYGLLDCIRFGSEVIETSFDEKTAHWKTKCVDGRIFDCNYLIMGIGGLHVPSIPDFPGRSDFSGPQFHTARWNHNVDLKGKRVAVIGTAASSVQVVPALAKEVKELYVFQRHANYCVPKEDYEYPGWFHALVRFLPLIALIYRWWLWFFFGEFLTAPAIKKRWPFTWLLTTVSLAHLHRQVKDPALIKKLTPTYPIGAKRILFADEYYPALTQPNVHLVTEKVSRIEPNGVATSDGSTAVVDAIVYATGFKVMSPENLPLIIGRSKLSLNETWKGTPRAYLGLTVADFPNFFILLGPNTGLGHNSVLVMIEAQVSYLIDLLKKLDTQEKRCFEVKVDIQERYNSDLQKDLAKTVWACEVESWYKNSEGTNFTCWPHTTWAYIQLMRSATLSDYNVT